MKNNALKINEKDNVVIAMNDIKNGDAIVVDGKEVLKAVVNIEAGHKIALTAMAPGEQVFRYGEPVVETTRAIEPGEWVHVHNTQPIKADLAE